MNYAEVIKYLWASKFAHSDCSCNESNAYNNTLPADSNTDVPFTICP